jgi:DNA-binding CsgD family transcriptional regulator
MGGEEHMWRWFWLAWLLALDVWDDETWHELADNAVKLARDAGALTALPVVLEYRAAVHLHAGEFAAAAALIDEATTITTATGAAPVSYTLVALLAWRGDEVQALKLIDARAQEATATGEGRALGLVGYSTAVLNNGLGRYEAAVVGAQQAAAYEDLGFFAWSLVELVEAGVRSGAHTEAATAMLRLDERTSAAGTDWALGIRARSRALLSDGDAAEQLYREAIRRLERSRIAVHLARAHLIYGEWLRREQRRVDAREHLRTAHDMLGRFGAGAFAERARQELRATGETVRKRSADSRDILTAQEARVARLAAEGHTNHEIGAQLFISARTAEYHLRKVFSKLDISSRRQLRGRLAQLERSAG